MSSFDSSKGPNEVNRPNKLALALLIKLLNKLMSDVNGLPA